VTRWRWRVVMLGSLSCLLRLPDSTSVLHLGVCEQVVTQTALPFTFTKRVDTSLQYSDD